MSHGYFLVDSVPIEVTRYVRDREGDVTDWDLEIGGVRITDSCDFLSPYVVAELERQVKRHDDEESAMAMADAAISSYLDRRAA